MKNLKKYSKTIGIIFSITIGIFIITYVFFYKSSYNQNLTTSTTLEFQNTSEPILGSNRNLSVPGIQFFPFSDEFIDKFDIGYRKWFVIFENLKNSDWESCGIKRLYSSNPDEFVPISSFLKNIEDFSKELKSIKTKKGKNAALPYNNFMLLVSEKGYLPGEKVSIRAKSSTSEEYDTLSFYPRPLVLFDENGKEIAGAELININPAMYNIYIVFNPENRLVLFKSKSGPENINQMLYQNEPITMTTIPDVINMKGGICSFSLTYQNGHTYTFSLPWGDELISYNLENK